MLTNIIKNRELKFSDEDILSLQEDTTINNIIINNDIHYHTFVSGYNSVKYVIRNYNNGIILKLSDIGYTDNDIKFAKNGFTKSFMQINYINEKSDLNSEILTYVKISQIYDTDFYNDDIINPSNSIPFVFKTSHIVPYKNGHSIRLKSMVQQLMYADFFFFNAKTGDKLFLYKNQTTTHYDRFVRTDIYPNIKTYSYNNNDINYSNLNNEIIINLYAKI